MYAANCRVADHVWLSVVHDLSVSLFLLLLLKKKRKELFSFRARFCINLVCESYRYKGYQDQTVADQDGRSVAMLSVG